MSTHLPSRLFTLVPLLAPLCLAILTSTSFAQQSQPADRPTVQRAAFERPAADSQQQTVRFGRQPARVGDQTEQTIALEMKLTLNMRRGNELLGKNQSTVVTNQRRIMTAMAVDSGITNAMKVTYPESTKRIIGAPGPGVAVAPDGTDANISSPQAPQPVQGKTYLCRREPGENGKLIVTDEAGNEPPAAEREIVAQQMDMVGRQNPLAQYLAGREVAVGQSLELPKEVAAQIFNLGEKFGQVTRFTLTLQNVQNENGSTNAVFNTNVEAASIDANQMRLQVEGPLVVQVDTCRAAKISLIGPLGMSETRGTYSTAYQVIGTGRLQMSVASTFRQSQQR
jgi:hypothetical protein